MKEAIKKPEQEELTIDLAAFSGPLDLLLHLIKDFKVDIFDIPIQLITEKFLQVLEDSATRDLETYSDYLVMAATLIEMKTKYLLPKPPAQEKAEDPRKPLVNRLFLYEQYQALGATLEEKHEKRQRFYSKPMANLENYQEEVPLPADAFDINDLYRAFRRTLKRFAASQAQPLKITYDPFSVQEAILSLRHYLQQAQVPASFLDFLQAQPLNRDRFVLLFFAILELVKAGELRIQQFARADIILEYQGEAK